MKLNEADFADDPYGEAMDVITQALSISMSDRIAGAMDEREYATLEQLAMRIADFDPEAAKKIDPRLG